MFASLALVDGLVATIFFNVKSPHIAYLQSGKWKVIKEKNCPYYSYIFYTGKVYIDKCIQIMQQIELQKLTGQFQQILQASFALLKVLYRVLPPPKKQLTKFQERILSRY